MRAERARQLLILAVCALALLPACIGRQPSEPSPTATPSAQDTLNAAADRFATINSAHYRLQIDGDVFLDAQGTISLRGAEGDLLRPMSATAKADVSFAGATLTVNMVAIGEDQYITNFLTGSWERAPQGLGYNPSTLFDRDTGIEGILRKVQQASIVGEEELDGAKVQHLRGQVARADVTPITGGTFVGDPIDFDLWVTNDAHGIVQIVLHDTAASQGAKPATWTLHISDLNHPVTINRPEG